MVVSIPIGPAKEAKRKPRQSNRKARKGARSAEARECCADGNFRQIENLREQIDLRQFQRAEESECPDGMTAEAFQYLKFMLVAHRRIYTVRYEELDTRQMVAEVHR